MRELADEVQIAADKRHLPPAQAGEIAKQAGLFWVEQTRECSRFGRDGLKMNGHRSKIGTCKKCSGTSKAGMVRIAQGLAMAGGKDVGRNR